MRILLGIQARTNSTRLPGKIYEKIGDKEVLLHIVDACNNVKVLSKINEYVVAVLAPINDDRIVKWCEEKDIEYFQGSEEDLIDRYVKAAYDFKADAVIRITGDCWSIPTEIIEETVKVLGSVDYASNCIVRSYPEGWDIQGISTEALQWVNTHQLEEREHPFKALDENELVRKAFIKVGFTLSSIVNPNNIIFQKNSIDTKEDLERARRNYDG